MNITNRDYDLYYAELKKHSLAKETKKEMRSEIHYGKNINASWEEDDLSSVVPKLCSKFDWEESLDDDEEEYENKYEDVYHLPLMERLNYYHDADEHEIIIGEIVNLPKEEITYEVKGLLARAYNNNAQSAEAIEVLESIRTEGENDPLWFFRYGYALYYLDLDKVSEALKYFEKCKALDPNDQDVDAFIKMCKEELRH
jgi:tetratricopeptide (TPR) repeat protein